MPVRVGVVGVGFMGKTHIGIHAKNKRAKITAICDYDPRRTSGDVGTAAGNLGSGSGLKLSKAVKRYQKPEELFADPHVDMVDICLPTYVHAEYVIKALNAGKHVLCEKPLALDLKDLERILKAAKKSKSMLMPAHCMRFWPEWVWLKNAIKSHKYGRVHSATFKRFASTPGWSKGGWILNAELSGSALFDLHIHDTDFVRYAFGDPKAVFSVGNGGKASKDGIDHVFTTYLYKNRSLVVTAEGGWNADPTYGFTMRYTVVFDTATADFDIGRDGRTLLLHRSNSKQAEVVKVSKETGWAQEIDYFLQCIEKGKKPLIATAQDGRDSVALIHTEYESIKQRKVVKV